MCGNAYDETALIEAIPRDSIMEREPELLKLAFANMPGILVKEADVLIVNEMGKNYSGTGVDPNISGTWSTEFGKGGLKVKRTCFLDLTDCSHGNANGMGLADIITARLFDKLDPEVIYPNCFTSTVLRSGMMPLLSLRTKKPYRPASVLRIRLTGITAGSSGSRIPFIWVRLCCLSPIIKTL